MTMNGNFTYHNPTKLHFGENAMAALVGELKNFGTTVMLSYGGMPKDADFNCGVDDSIRPVDAFAQTKGASGGVDFWGNCWEWTATKRNGKNAVKGGAYDSKRTDCRTEAKNTAKDASKGYPNVTIRLVREEHMILK